ncbi:MAG: hypothetical protein NTW80_10670, partial [Deltaproteobacteria bacterium]|nr:hypothetical protein [Deltaproteobacteria bacterium]
MGMKVEWDCKHGHTNDPEDPNYSWLRCSECSAWRWDWLKWAAGGVAGLVVIVLGIYLKGILFPPPETIYKNNYKKYLLIERKFEISPQAQNALDQIAKRYQF